MTAVVWFVLACGVLAILYGIVTSRAVLAASPGSARMQEVAAAILFVTLGWKPGLGFIIGALLSGAAGYIGMNVSVRANVRTAQGAMESLARGLDLSFKAGAVTGMLVAGLALLGVAVYFYLLITVFGHQPTDRIVVDS